MNVYLAGNSKEIACDYKVKGCQPERSYTIYAGSSTNESNVIAGMRKKFTAQNIALGKNEYGITVNPHADSAFVIALVAILNEIEHVSVDKDHRKGIAMEGVKGSESCRYSASPPMLKSVGARKESKEKEYI
ncbi:hypothetical protein L6164_002449 [Bauhinia variegata]|uniref:Uncharacterized protein n=1 Tax=Bauhinia variegata TaxID=167791 RepID=A0ACB9PXG1_BAUVA|nr:hypothetical protein L6164_002449 [Bauhinia variegata]